MTVRIRCFPSTDRAFFDLVHEAARSLSSTEAASVDAVAKVREALHARYPNLRISVREGLAMLRPDEPQWYAYRDGRPDARGPGAALHRGRRAINRAISAVRHLETAA